MNGILNIHKPPGPTSFDVVRLVRKATGLRRVGHGGTLDPTASGVLPILLGQGTRAAEYLLSAAKTYRADVLLGIATDTHDAQGRPVFESDPAGVTLAQVQATLEQFRGMVLQRPPMHSALKHQGQPLYRLARAGIQVERQARPVRIYDLRLVRWEPPVLAIEVVCGRGTYIRSLAHDLGMALGCGAHLGGLVRTRVGPFTLEDALSIEQLFDAALGGSLEPHVYSLDWAMLDLPVLILSPEEAPEVLHGHSLVAQDNMRPTHSVGPCRAYSADGDLVAVMALKPGERQWQPVKVFSLQEPSNKHADGRPPGMLQESR